MALIGFEGFDHEATNSAGLDLSGKPFTSGIGGSTGGVWSGTLASSLQKIAGSLGGFALTLTTTANVPVLTFSTAYATAFFGFRYKMAATNATLTDFLYFMDGATVQCGLSINASGKIIFWRGTNATILETGTTILTGSSVYFIEVSPTINNSTGAITVKINGVTEFTASSLNTRTSANNQFTAIGLRATGIAGSTFDDLYGCDGTGSSPFNTFLGIIRVETLFPATANATTWTPNASTNVSRVQETSTDGDTTYNSTTTSGNADTFTHGSLSSIPSAILAVDISVCARKDDVGVQSIETQLISNGTTQTGTSNPVTTSYAYYRDSYQNDPHTGSAWTGTNVNATDIGYKHV